MQTPVSPTDDVTTAQKRLSGLTVTSTDQQDTSGSDVIDDVTPHPGKLDTQNSKETALKRQAAVDEDDVTEPKSEREFGGIQKTSNLISSDKPYDISYCSNSSNFI